MKNKLPDLRNHLFEAIEMLKSGDIEIHQAQAINNLAQTLVASAKVEVDYLRATEGGESSFISSAVGQSNLPPGISTSVVHRLKG